MKGTEQIMNLNQNDFVNETYSSSTTEQAQYFRLNFAQNTQKSYSDPVNIYQTESKKLKNYTNQSHINLTQGTPCSKNASSGNTLRINDCNINSKSENSLHNKCQIIPFLPPPPCGRKTTKSVNKVKQNESKIKLDENYVPIRKFNLSSSSKSSIKENVKSFSRKLQNNVNKCSNPSNQNDLKSNDAKQDLKFNFSKISNKSSESRNIDSVNMQNAFPDSNTFAQSSTKKLISSTCEKIFHSASDFAHIRYPMLLNKRSENVKDTQIKSNLCLKEFKVENTENKALLKNKSKPHQKIAMLKQSRCYSNSSSDVPESPLYQNFLYRSIDSSTCTNSTVLNSMGSSSGSSSSVEPAESITSSSFSTSDQNSPTDSHTSKQSFSDKNCDNKKGWDGLKKQSIQNKIKNVITPNTVPNISATRSKARDNSKTSYTSTEKLGRKTNKSTETKYYNCNSQEMTTANDTKFDENDQNCSKIFQMKNSRQNSKTKLINENSEIASRRKFSQDLPKTNKIERRNSQIKYENRTPIIINKFSEESSAFFQNQLKLKLETSDMSKGNQSNLNKNKIKTLNTPDFKIDLPDTDGRRPSINGIFYPYFSAAFPYISPGEMTLKELYDIDTKWGSPHRRRSRRGSMRKPSHLTLPPSRLRMTSLPNRKEEFDAEEEYYRMRHFSITGKRIVNEGDTFKSRRCRSNNSVTSDVSSNEPWGGPWSQPASLGTSAASSAPSSRASSASAAPDTGANVSYRVVMLGAPGVGKTTLCHQFMTSEHINGYDNSLDEEFGEKTVSIMLDGIESDLQFIDHPSDEMSVENYLSTYNPHAIIIVFSVVDRTSFERAEETIQYLWRLNIMSIKGVILVANKSDIVRNRCVSQKESSNMAHSYDCKYIETSSGLNHKVDELLVGIVKQIRLKITCPEKSEELFRKRSLSRSKYRRHIKSSASLRIKNFLEKVCGTELRSKSCENLHVL